MAQLYDKESPLSCIYRYIYLYDVESLGIYIYIYVYILEMKFALGLIDCSDCSDCSGSMGRMGHFFGADFGLLNYSLRDGICFLSSYADW